MAFRDDSKRGYVHHLTYGPDPGKDFTVARTDSKDNWKSPSKGCGPTLAVLGPDRLALIWTEKDGSSRTARRKLTDQRFVDDAPVIVIEVLEAGAADLEVGLLDVALEAGVVVDEPLGRAISGDSQ